MAPQGTAPYATPVSAPAPYGTSRYTSAPATTGSIATASHATASSATPSTVATTSTTPYGTYPYARTAAAAASYATTPYSAPPYPGAAYRTAPYGTDADGMPPYGTGLYAYAPSAAEGPYTLDTGDRLRIVVFGQDGLTNSYIVGAGGAIDLPLIGPVQARGASSDELTKRVSDKLRNGFIREPHVAVEIEAYRPFFILGEVTAPGQYPYVANMTAETAVAIAGGFTPRAFRRDIILSRTYSGRLVRMAVPLTFPLRPGDTINVQERWF
jgi:hypothetical protein